jgi:CxxC motif-containing protein
VKEINMKKEQIICVGCPVGCRIVLSINQEGNIDALAGNECKIGEKYAAQEYTAPVRVFTGTVRTRNCSRPLLPVRTSKAVPKKLIWSFSNCLIDVKVKPPIRLGDVIISNIHNTGVDLIATNDLED